MTCPYGCSTENIEQKCTRCGHLKKWHSQIHPHQCNGEMNDRLVHFKSSCVCPGFTNEKEKAKA